MLRHVRSKQRPQVAGPTFPAPCDIEEVRVRAGSPGAKSHSWEVAGRAPAPRPLDGKLTLWARHQCFPKRFPWNPGFVPWMRTAGEMLFVPLRKPPRRALPRRVAVQARGRPAVSLQAAFPTQVARAALVTPCWPGSDDPTRAVPWSWSSTPEIGQFESTPAK